MLEITQSHLLLQMIQRFKQELSVLEREVYATIPARKPPISMVLTNPKTGKPFEKKSSKSNRNPKTPTSVQPKKKSNRVRKLNDRSLLGGGSLLERDPVGVK